MTFAARPIGQTADTVIVTPGFYENDGPGLVYSTYNGYSLGQSIGSIVSGGTLSSGRTVTALRVGYNTDSEGITEYYTDLSISGFASDPGQNSLLQFTDWRGTSVTGASAGYSYSGGTATWTWGRANNVSGIGYGFTSTQPFLIQF